LQYDDRGWRATFYTTGMEHSPTSATGTGWERPPWRATRAGGVGCVEENGARLAVTQFARIALLVVVSLLFLLRGTLSAQSGSEIVDRVKKRRAAERCAEEVKRGDQFSRFDAYVGADGAARWIGTEREAYLFLKCMDREGFPVEPEPRR
jgi:hypothetical protein